MGIEEARNDLGGIVDRARLRYEPTTITRQGKPAAVVTNVEWYEKVKLLIAHLEQNGEPGGRTPGGGWALTDDEANEIIRRSCEEDPS